MVFNMLLLLKNIINGLNIEYAFLSLYWNIKFSYHYIYLYYYILYIFISIIFQLPNKNNTSEDDNVYFSQVKSNAFKLQES